MIIILMMIYSGKLLIIDYIILKLHLISRSL
nr:MAG TPA: hypothetical protein [Caudoviricetes sp.]